MRTELGESPVAFKIDQIGKRAQITFFENAVKLPPVDDKPRWQADMFTLDVPNRAGLTAAVELNYKTWLDLAKAQEDVQPPKALDERMNDVEATIDLIAEVLL
jgi:hypothetical protein